MRFDLNDEQRAIKQAVHDLCESHYDLATAHRTADGEHTDKLWPALTASGWAALAVPAEFGGQGLGLLELSLVVEELGYALSPATFFNNAAAGVLIATSGGAEQQRRWLPGIASGEARAAVGIATRDGAPLVLDGEGAALLVMLSPEAVRLVDAADSDQKPVSSLDLTRQMTRVTSARANVLPNDAQPALDRVEVLLAAELLGVAQHAMELAVAYARQRQQFGRPIGAYQAVSHRCADMLLMVESARSAVLSAGWTADHEPERLPFAASVAKAVAADAAWQVATSALQIHGGIGFTWEHPIHLFVRRAAVSSRLLGSVDHHLDRAAHLAGLGAAERQPELVSA